MKSFAASQCNGSRILYHPDALTPMVRFAGTRCSPRGPSWRTWSSTTSRWMTQVSTPAAQPPSRWWTPPRSPSSGVSTAVSFTSVTRCENIRWPPASQMEDLHHACGITMCRYHCVIFSHVSLSCGSILWHYQSCVIIICHDQVSSSTMCHYHLLASCLIIIFHHHVSSSCIIITCHHHASSSCVINSQTQNVKPVTAILKLDGN